MSSLELIRCRLAENWLVVFKPLPLTESAEVGIARGLPLAVNRLTANVSSDNGCIPFGVRP